MLTRTKTFSLTMAALLVLTLATGVLTIAALSPHPLECNERAKDI